jgi:hybrid cluster-associated redox disulfide protein
MIYYKTSQPVPGKGEAWMYYECGTDETVRRYLTYIPATGEIDRVPNPFIKNLQRPEMLMPSTEDEFQRFWPPDEDGADDGSGNGNGAAEKPQASSAGNAAPAGTHFNADMTVVEAMAVHPQVAEVFAAFHLGGCANCGVSEIETVGQVCMSYGIDIDVLLEVLEGLMEDEVEEETARAAE